MPWTTSPRPNKKKTYVVCCWVHTNYKSLVVVCFVEHKYVCVCVVIPFILDIKFVGRTTRGHTGGKFTRDFSSTFLLRCVPSFFSREGFSRSFPLSTVKSNLRFINHSPLVGHFLFFIFYFFVRKNPSLCDDTEIRTHVPTSEGFEVTN